jgi:REP element-mobilizing transposase RayT
LVAGREGETLAAVRLALLAGRGWRSELFRCRAVSLCERTQNLGQAANRGNRRLTDIVVRRNLIPVIQEKTSKRKAEKRSAFRRSESSGIFPGMPDYRRNRVPRGTFFFTVKLRDPRSDLLVRQIDILCDAVRRVRARTPFRIDGWVVLPDHMHCLWTLPQGDADFSGRWRAIKTAFVKCLPTGEARSPVIGSGGIGSTPYATLGILRLTWTTRIPTR